MKNLISIIVVLVFLANSVGPIPLAQADELRLPAPGVRVDLSPEFDPPVLKGIKVNPANPLNFDFILDQGDSSVPSVRSTATRLIKYFLASLTIPEKDLWVNLSPYEKDRVVPDSFGQTEMGRDLLAEDYMLKQITASLIYPEGETGRRFWKRVYQEAAQKFGTTNIPVNTFNKVWIIPEKAVVYENAKAGTAYVVSSSLKVMLDQDYLSMQKHMAVHNDMGSIGANIIREIVIPELTREVNHDRNFAQLRQVYNSLILAAWYKKKIKDSILSQVYDDQKKISGLSFRNVSANEPDVEFIYQRYLEAFKKGVYNYIKEEQDPLTQQTTPRKYFSGGASFYKVDSAMTISEEPPADFNVQEPLDVTVDLTMGTSDQAMNASAPRFHRAISSFVMNKGQVKKLALENNIATRTPDMMLVFVILEAIGLPLTRARAIGLDKLLLSWCQYVRLGDTILDSYGKLFSINELEKMLVQSGDDFPIIPNSALAEKGLSDDVLRGLPVKTIAKDDHRNRAEILADFNRNADTLIAQMPLTPAQKAGVKRVFVATSRKMFGSYILERKYGSYPTFEQTVDVVDAKSCMSTLIALRGVFFEGADKKAIAQNEALLLDFEIYLQIVDDYLDLEGDFGTQPNIVLSIARQYYPQEFERLVSLLKEKRSFKGLGGWRALIKVMPNTNRKVLSYAYSYFKRISAVKPATSLLVTSYGLYKLITDRGRPETTQNEDAFSALSVLAQVAPLQPDFLSERSHETADSAQLSGTVLFENSTSFEKNDLDDVDSRYKKRLQLLKGLTLEWNGLPSQQNIEKNKILFNELVERRIAWYRQEEIQTILTNGGEVKVTPELLREQLIDEPVSFILDEILKNAFDAYVAAGSTGPISFKMIKEDGAYVIEVMDDGVGIDFRRTYKDDIWHVVSNRRNNYHFEREGGRGIGILWTQLLAQVYGGKLEILPAETKGYKTMVRITLPQDAIKINVDSAQLSRQPDGRPVRVSMSASLQRLAFHDWHYRRGAVDLLYDHLNDDNFYQWSSDLISNFIEPAGIEEAKAFFKEKNMRGELNPEAARANARLATLFALKFDVLKFTKDQIGLRQEFREWIAQRIKNEVPRWFAYNHLSEDSPEVMTGTADEIALIKGHLLGHLSSAIPAEFAFLENIRLIYLAAQMRMKGEIPFKGVEYWVYSAIENMIQPQGLSPAEKAVVFSRVGETEPLGDVLDQAMAANGDWDQLKVNLDRSKAIFSDPSAIVHLNALIGHMMSIGNANGIDLEAGRLKALETNGSFKDGFVDETGRLIRDNGPTIKKMREQGQKPPQVTGDRFKQALTAKLDEEYTEAWEDGARANNMAELKRHLVNLLETARTISAQILADHAMSSINETAEDFYNFDRKVENVRKLEEVLEEVMQGLSTRFKPVIVGGTRYMGPGRKDVDVVLQGADGGQHELWMAYVQALADRLNKVKGVKAEILKDEPFLLHGAIAVEALKVELVSSSGQRAVTNLDILLDISSDDVILNKLKVLLKLSDAAIKGPFTADLVKLYFMVEYYIGDNNAYRSVRQRYQSGTPAALQDEIRQRMLALKAELSQLSDDEVKLRIQQRLFRSVTDWAILGPSRPLSSSVSRGIHVEVYPDISSVDHRIARRRADILKANNLAGKPTVFICPTGGTQDSIYTEFVRIVKEERIDLSHLITFNMDEYYVGPDYQGNWAENPQSYRYYMEHHLFSQLRALGQGWNDANVHFLNGQAPDVDAEAARYEKEFQELRDTVGIDLAVGGIGWDGHMAFIEPVITIDERTVDILKIKDYNEFLLKIDRKDWSRIDNFLRTRWNLRKETNNTEYLKDEFLKAGTVVNHENAVRLARKLMLQKVTIYLDGLKPSDIGQLQDMVKGVAAEFGLGPSSVEFKDSGSIFNARTHAVELALPTIIANSRYFKKVDEIPLTALTIGPGTMLDTKEVMIAATGPLKAEPVYQAVAEPETPAVSASILQRHKKVTFVLDPEAGGLYQESHASVRPWDTSRGRKDEMKGNEIQGSQLVKALIEETASVTLANIKQGEEPVKLEISSDDAFFQPTLQVDVFVKGQKTGRLMLNIEKGFKGQKGLISTFNVFPIGGPMDWTYNYYKGKGIASTILNWLAWEAAENDCELRNAGTSNIPLIKLFLNYFGGSKARLVQDNAGHSTFFEALAHRYGFYSQQVLGDVSDMVPGVLYDGQRHAGAYLEKAPGNNDRYMVKSLYNYQGKWLKEGSVIIIGQEGDTWLVDNGRYSLTDFVINSSGRKIVLQGPPSFSQVPRDAAMSSRDDHQAAITSITAFLKARWPQFSNIKVDNLYYSTVDGEMLGDNDHQFVISFKDERNLEFYVNIRMKADAITWLTLNNNGPKTALTDQNRVLSDLLLSLNDFKVKETGRDISKFETPIIFDGAFRFFSGFFGAYGAGGATMSGDFGYEIVEIPLSADFWKNLADHAMKGTGERKMRITDNVRDLIEKIKARQVLAGPKRIVFNDDSIGLLPDAVNNMVRYQGLEGYIDVDLVSAAYRERVPMIDFKVNEGAVNRNISINPLYIKEIRDNAMKAGNAALDKVNKGGIDFNPAHMDLQTQGAGGGHAGIRFHLDPAMLAQLQNATGFVPVIIDIKPMVDIRKFLGIPSPEIPHT